ncbi:MAG TPA: hypothetical protein VMT53_24685 [Terriglobales bacterium]|nr:hypothetical protein [Terriglobales bacterium]
MKLTRNITIGRPMFFMVAVVTALAICSPSFFRVLGANSPPQVKLNADGIAPRSIEELTGRNVTRDYAYAWRDLAIASQSNRADLLNDYFTGFAKDNFTQRIADQQRTGVTIRYTDHGHSVKAFFYSPDGGEMQLLDNAQLDIAILDGGKVVHQENVSQRYLVLMTPGADRWFVRSLTPAAK